MKAERERGQIITREEYDPDDEPDPDRAAPPEDPMALWRQIEESCPPVPTAD